MGSQEKEFLKGSYLTSLTRGGSQELAPYTLCYGDSCSTPFFVIHRTESSSKHQKVNTILVPPGCFSKDQVYLDGILQILRYRETIDFHLLTTLGKVSETNGTQFPDTPGQHFLQLIS